MTTIVQIFDAQGSLRWGDATETVLEAMEMTRDAWNPETSHRAVIITCRGGWIMTRVSDDGTNWECTACLPSYRAA